MDGLYDRLLFPRICELAMRGFDRHRAPLLAQATGRVAEVGMGSGQNLRLLRGISSYVGIEPSSAMTDVAKARVEAAPFPVEVVHAGAEAIPLPDASVDTVISTFVLCTIPDVTAALAEVKRILRPGGRVLVLEHVVSPEPRIARIEHAINPLWRRLAGGCEIDRDTSATLARAGFRTSGLVHVPARFSKGMLDLVEGIAEVR